jgi:hypothetical protein
MRTRLKLYHRVCVGQSLVANVSLSIFLFRKEQLILHTFIYAQPILIYRKSESSLLNVNPKSRILTTYNAAKTASAPDAVTPGAGSS